MGHMTDAQHAVMLTMHIVIIVQGLVMIAAQTFRIVRGEQTYKSTKRTETILRNGSH